LAAIANYTINQFGFRSGAIAADKIRKQRARASEKVGAND
jgi:hypothetical protein